MSWNKTSEILQVLEWIAPYPKDLLADPSGHWKELAQKWGHKGPANIAKGTTLRWNPETKQLKESRVKNEKNN